MQEILIAMKKAMENASIHVYPTGVPSVHEMTGEGPSQPVGSQKQKDREPSPIRVMTILRVNNDAKYLCFPVTLGGSVEEWFKKLELGSVDCWYKLQTDFGRQFIASRKINLEVSALTNMKKLLLETLKNFITRMNSNRKVQLAFKIFQKRAQKYFNLEETQIMIFGGYYPTGGSRGPALRACSQYPAQSASLAASVATTPQASQSKRLSNESTWSENKKPKRVSEYNPQYTQHTDLVDT
uniref:Retrotransposon gag domain-containing protein n=1 Tax=Cannabis sativa TaxID=3483 RepID=A0A803PYY7_CANSA